MPPQTRTNTDPTNRRELPARRGGGLWMGRGAPVPTTAAYMITVNYLAELITEVSRLPDAWIAGILALFGVGAYVGLAISGRIADRHPHHALVAGAVGIVACSVLLATLAEHQPAVVVLVFLLGVTGFVLNPAIYGRVFDLAFDAPTLAGATTVSAFQLGISLVPVLAGIVLDAGAPVTAVAWIGAGLGAITIPLVTTEKVWSRAEL
jgi:DHA1 family chloramphenicol resistance protein-like MFS transporter